MKILIVKLSSLGDVIQTMPVVSDLLQAYPDAQIDWVVEEAFAPLVARVQGLHRVLPIAQRRWRKAFFQAQTRAERRAFITQLHTQAYDAVIDFQGLIKSALVARQARLAPGGFRATYANGSEACSYEWPVRYLLDRAIPMAQRIHAVARYRSLASAALGYALQGLPVYRLNHAGVAPQATVVLAHGTTRADNEWPQECWIELGRKLVAGGVSVALPQAGAAEWALANSIAKAIGPQAQVWPRMALPELLDQMAACIGVIGVDSGLSHLAVALDLPHVQIFSQPRAWRAGPVGKLHQVALGGESAPEVSEVWRAWLEVTGVPTNYDSDTSRMGLL